MAVMRWRHDAHLFAFAVIARSLALYGRRTRRLHRQGWVVRPGIAMGGSFVALLTAFYIDNGAQLPLWTGFRTGRTGSCRRLSACR
jgi:hypothetical protein